MISEIRKKYENDKNKNIEIITQKLNQEKEGLTQLEQSNFFSKLFKRKQLNLKINDQRNTIEQLESELKNAEQICCKNHYNDFKGSEIKDYISQEDVILDESDLEEYKYNTITLESNRKREIQNLDDLIMVHKTNFLPQNGIIRTGYDTKAMKKDNILLNNKQYNYEFRAGNNTIHFAINGPVSSHFYGNWNSTKFSVLTPMKACCNEINHMLRFGPEDTYSEGSFTLDQDSYIICPPEMKKEVRMKNPNIKIIEYKNISLDEATEILIFYFGYKNKIVSDDKWSGDSKDNDTFFEICKENDLKSQDTIHYDSEQRMRSQLFEKTYKILSLFNLVRENNIILDESDYENIFEESQIGSLSYFFPSREKILQVFFMFAKNLITLLESQGFSISIDEQKELEKMINKVVDGISLYNCDLTGRLNEISFLIIESYMYSLQIRNGAYDKRLETMEENVENKKR